MVENSMCRMETMPNHAPDHDMLEALAKAPAAGPVVMMNLLKFKRGGGSKQYGRYAAAFEGLLTKAGGRFLYIGRVAEKIVGDEDWDGIALVEYPSRKVFAEVIGSPEYQAIAPWREDGLEKTLLYATDPR